MPAILSSEGLLGPRELLGRSETQQMYYLVARVGYDSVNVLGVTEAANPESAADFLTEDEHEGASLEVYPLMEDVGGGPARHTISNYGTEEQDRPDLDLDERVLSCSNCGNHEFHEHSRIDGQRLPLECAGCGEVVYARIRRDS